MTDLAGFSSEPQLQMAVEQRGVFADDVRETLLEYALMPEPNPLQVGRAGSTLHVVVTNTGGTITCTRIAVTLPVGTGATSLIEHATFTAVKPAGWNATVAGATVTLTPLTPDAGRIGDKSIVLQLTGLRINDQPGMAPVIIEEWARSTSQPERQRVAEISVAKAPAEFFLDDLKAEPDCVAAGGAAVISWSGSPADYALRYNAADGRREITGLPSRGNHRAVDLVTFPCVFTLQASLTKPGWPEPIRVRRQFTVTTAPELAIPAFNASALGFGLGESIVLSWRVVLANRCTLRISGGNAIDVTSLRSCTATLVDATHVSIRADGRELAQLAFQAGAKTIVFVLSAADGKKAVQASFEVELIPARVVSFGGSAGYAARGIYYAEVRWETQGAGRVTLSEVGEVAANGKHSFYPWSHQSFTYVLTAYGSNGAVEARTTVRRS